VYAVQPSARRADLAAFVTGDTADYRRSDAIAEMAIKWAQERRENVEVRYVAYAVQPHTRTTYSVYN